MGSDRIEELRALAFASIPSASRRPAVPSLNTGAASAIEKSAAEQGKEEGELSSDEDPQSIDPPMNAQPLSSGSFGHNVASESCFQERNDENNGNFLKCGTMPLPGTLHFAHHYEKLQNLENYKPTLNHVEFSRFLSTPHILPHENQDFCSNVANSPSVKAVVNSESGLGNQGDSKQLSTFSLKSSAVMAGISVRKNADQLLPSSSLPVVSNTSHSPILADPKDDAFVIKFSNEDSDSDEEQPHVSYVNLSTSDLHPEGVVRSSTSLNCNSSVLKNTISVLNATSETKGKLYGIKRHGSNTEQNKGEALHALNAVKTYKRLRNTFATQQMAASPMTRANKSEKNKQAVSDLEVLRLKIAAKENELQRQRQLLAIRELGQKGTFAESKGLVSISASQPESTVGIHTFGLDSTEVGTSNVCNPPEYSSANTCKNLKIQYFDSTKLPQTEAQLQQSSCNLLRNTNEEQVSVSNKQMPSVLILSDGSQSPASADAVLQESQHQGLVPSSKENLQIGSSFSPQMGSLEVLASKKPEICRPTKRRRDNFASLVQNCESNFTYLNPPATKKQKSPLCQSSAGYMKNLLLGDEEHKHDHSMISLDAAAAPGVNNDIKISASAMLQSLATEEGNFVASSLSAIMSDAMILTERIQEPNDTDCVQLVTDSCPSKHSKMVQAEDSKGVMQSSPKQCDGDILSSVISNTPARPVGIHNGVDADRPAAGPAQDLDCCHPQTHTSLNVEAPTNSHTNCTVQIPPELQNDDMRALMKDFILGGDDELQSGQHTVLTVRKSDFLGDQPLNKHIEPQSASHREQSMVSSLDKINAIDEQILVQTVTNGLFRDSLHPLLEQLKAEEAMLDQQLEAAQQNRRRCEIRESLSWKTFRDAQDALVKANLECEFHYRRKEILHAQRRKAQNDQLSRYLLEAANTVKSIDGVTGSESLSLQELPFALDNDAVVKVKGLLLHDTSCSNINESKCTEHGYVKVRHANDTNGAAGVVPIASTIISSISYGMEGQKTMSNMHYTSQIVQKDDSHSQHSTLQKVCEVDGPNLSPYALNSDKQQPEILPWEENTEVNACLEGKEELIIGGQDGLVKQRDHKFDLLAAQEQIELEEEPQDIQSISDTLKASDRHIASDSVCSAGIGSIYTVEGSKDTIAIPNQMMCNSTEAVCREQIDSFSSKSGTSKIADVHFNDGNNHLFNERAETEPSSIKDRGSIYFIDKENNYPKSGDSTSQLYPRTKNLVSTAKSLQGALLQNECSKISLASCWEGQILVQNFKPVGDCQGMRDDLESHNAEGGRNGGGFTGLSCPAGAVLEGTSQFPHDSTQDTALIKSIPIAANLNIPPALGLKSTEQMKHHIDTAEITPSRIFLQDKPLSEGNIEPPFFHISKEHRLSHQPKSFKKEILSARLQSKENQMSDSPLPSADLMVVFNKLIGRDPKHARVFHVSSRKVNLILESNNDAPLHTVSYESPLNALQQRCARLRSSAGLQLPMLSSSLLKEINPFQPLCKFEHRGKCNDDDCCWQHKNGRTSAKRAAAQISKWKDYLTKVPIYRIGNYLMEDDMEALTSVRCLIQGRSENKTPQTHMFSLSMPRPSPLDMPCLLEPSKRLEFCDNKILGNFEAPSRQHRSHSYERQAYVEIVLREPNDIEAWLDLALSILEYDLQKLEPNTQKNALYVLSRALEANPTSVSLWVVYLHVYYWHRDSLGKDDLFAHAVKQNSGSYELWLLYIYSRFDLRQRLRSFEMAVTAVCEALEKIGFESSLQSSQVLDLVLQMFHCMCLSEQTQEAFSWIEDICFYASAERNLDIINSQRPFITALLKALHPKDACVLWVTSAYLLVCHQLPSEVVRRLGYEQHLVYDLSWVEQRRKSEVSERNAFRLFEIAASRGVGCLDLCSPASNLDKSCLFAKESLAVNYVQYTALLDGPEQAARLGQHCMLSFPRCVELVVLCARVKQQHSGVDAGLRVFEEALQRWPVNLPGCVRLWNQYAGHALEWKGKDSANKVLCKCAFFVKNYATVKNVEKASRYAAYSDSIIGKNLAPELLPCCDVEVTREILQSKCHLVKTSGVPDSILVQETAFALLNLALFEALNENFGEAETAAAKIFELSVEENFMHCWKEFVAVKFLVSCNQSGSRGPISSYETLLDLVDRCYQCAQLLPKLNPLAKRCLGSFKKHRIRCFFENFLGSPSLDSSLFNSILEICFGPELLPAEQHCFRDLVDFYGGLLEFVPSNVELALSFCQAAFSESSSKDDPSSVAAAFWAASTLTYSLFHSRPLALERHWLKAAVFLEELGLKEISQQFFSHALLSYPFSSSLWRSFIAFSTQCGDRESAVQAAHDRGLVFR